MHRLSSSFVLAYHGCDESVGEALLRGQPFKISDNDYDWLGPGVYFWESNPERGLEFAHEASRRRGSKITRPFVVGAIVELGYCLDLTTSSGIHQLRIAHESALTVSDRGGWELPRNSPDGLRRYLDCAVIRRVYAIVEDNGSPPIDSVKGIFFEGGPAYPGSGFSEKNTCKSPYATWPVSKASSACLLSPLAHQPFRLRIRKQARSPPVWGRWRLINGFSNAHLRFKVSQQTGLNVPFPAREIELPDRGDRR